MDNKKFRKTIQDIPEPKQQTCTAAGCPLFGTRASGSGASRWWCRFHYGQELSNFSRITERIERSRAMIEHIKRLKTANASDVQQAPAWLTVYQNNPKFNRNENETHGAYTQRLELALKNAILQNIEHSHLNSAKDMVSTFAESVSVSEKSWDEKIQQHARSTHE